MTDTLAATVSGKIDLPSQSPYMDILADLMTILHGKGYMVAETPMLKLASLCIEYELADRILDEQEREYAERSH